MTTNIESELGLSTGIQEAVVTIDQALSRFAVRELVSTSEVADLLLDVRTLLQPSAR